MQFGYWDSLKNGLLAGDHLAHDLKRLDMAYLDGNHRECELTKHVSLLQVAPLALVQFRETGRCSFRLPEEVFDLDFPGHYFRRIKSVGLTLPCVTGPFTTVSCTLRLVRSSIRVQSEIGVNGYGRNTDADGRPIDDPRFVDENSPPGPAAIATSSGQNDSGEFELSFRDERYFPFENSGAISEWQLEMPADPSQNDPAQFDYGTISDVILHVRYMAREGGSLLRDKALARVKELVTQAQAVGTARLFSVRHEFPTEWARFQRQSPAANQRFELTLDLRAEHYPFWSRGRLNHLKHVEVLGRSTQDPAPDSLEIFEKEDRSDGSKLGTLTADADYGNLLRGALTAGLPSRPDAQWKLYFETRAIDDLWLVVTWSE